LSHFKKYHPSGEPTFNNLGIFKARNFVFVEYNESYCHHITTQLASEPFQRYKN